jgi:hypothetical protein
VQRRFRRYDASYAVEVQRAHPSRFGIVKPVDPDDPDVADVVADWKNTPGTVRIRVTLPKEAGRDPNDPGLDRILRARFSSQHAVLEQSGRGRCAHRSPSRHPRLIDRTIRSVALTGDGALLLDHARILLADAAGLEARSRVSRRKQSVTLRLGAIAARGGLDPSIA